MSRPAEKRTSLVPARYARASGFQFAVMCVSAFAFTCLISMFGFQFIIGPLKRELQWKRLRTDPELRQSIVTHLAHESTAIEQLIDIGFEGWAEEMRRTQWRIRQAEAMLKEEKPISEVIAAFPDVMQQFIP